MDTNIAFICAFSFKRNNQIFKVLSISRPCIYKYTNIGVRISNIRSTLNGTKFLTTNSVLLYYLFKLWSRVSFYVSLHLNISPIPVVRKYESKYQMVLTLNYTYIFTYLWALSFIETKLCAWRHFFLSFIQYSLAFRGVTYSRERKIAMHKFKSM